jgi:hypothetical protein
VHQSRGPGNNDMEIRIGSVASFMVVLLHRDGQLTYRPVQSASSLPDGAYTKPPVPLLACGSCEIVE